MTNERIEGRVATILNARELVITVGNEDGVSRGMRFKVLADTPMTVTHPETGEQIGIVDREKVRVEAIEVQEKLSICQTYERVTVGAGLPDLSKYFLTRQVVPRTLKADESSYPEPLSEEDSYVKRGDRVVEIYEADATHSD